MIDPERLGHGQCRAHVPAQHDTGHGADLTAQPPGQVPYLPSFQRMRRVQDLRAVRARAFAGCAVPFAPAIDPVGEGAEAFFSASSSRPFAT